MLLILLPVSNLRHLFLDFFKEVFIVVSTFAIRKFVRCKWFIRWNFILGKLSLITLFGWCNSLQNYFSIFDIFVQQFYLVRESINLVIDLSCIIDSAFYRALRFKVLLADFNLLKLYVLDINFCKLVELLLKLFVVLDVLLLVHCFNFLSLS